MKSIFVFTTLFAASLASQYILPLETTSKVHSQDIFGQYYYGYNDGLSTKQEIRALDGTTRGSYSYVDANGKIQTVDYVADPLHGFRVAGTNLPKPLVAEKRLPLEPIKDTPEVTAAKRDHLKIVEDTKRGIIPTAASALSALPKPVMDTPEVAKAKVEHFAAKKQAELSAQRPEIIVQKPHIISTALPISDLRQIGLGALSGYSSFGPFSAYNPHLYNPYGALFDYRYAGAPLVFSRF